MTSPPELYDMLDEVVSRHHGARWWHQYRPVLASTAPVMRVDGETWRGRPDGEGRYTYTLRQARQIRQRLIQHMGAVYEGRLTRLVSESSDMP